MARCASPTATNWGWTCWFASPGNETLDITRDDLGRISGMHYTLADGNKVDDSISRSQSGQIISGQELGDQKQYSYDKAGRLVKATLGNTTYSYDFGQPTGCGTDANPNAGADGNRTSQIVDNGTTTKKTTYCYDTADRLISSTDPLESNPEYDAHGNAVQFGGGSSPTTLLGYDASDRNISLTEGDDRITYSRDVNNRVTRRDEVKGSTHAIDYYGFTGTGDDPDLVFNGHGSLTTRYVELPGGTLLTLADNTDGAPWSRVNVPTAGSSVQTTLSLIDVHGDVIATSDSAGKLVKTFRYDPFGNLRGGTDSPSNSVDGTSYGWLGQHEKLAEASLDLKPIQMGARVYLPTLGRFASTDPVPGGTPSAYAYPPDPVNTFDLDGRCPICVLAAVYAVVDAASTVYAGYDLYKHPSLGNALAFGAGLVGFGWAKAVAKGGKIAEVVKNSNNYLRIGRGRVSIGPAPTKYEKMRFWRNIPMIHAHFDRGGGGFDVLWRRRKPRISVYIRWR